jgi:hypothetical protein
LARATRVACLVHCPARSKIAPLAFIMARIIGITGTDHLHYMM